MNKLSSEVSRPTGLERVRFHYYRVRQGGIFKSCSTRFARERLKKHKKKETIETNNELGRNIFRRRPIEL